MCSVSELPGVRLGAGRGPLRRCLCWCCCCTCTSCLTVRSNEDNGPTKKEPASSDMLICDGEPPPSIEEIQSWGKSFDKLMRSSAGRKVFRDFLRCEYSEENILFWLACEELKRESNPDAVEEKARFIYEDYISILSPKEVSLDSRVREVVNRNMVEPTPHTFDEAQLQIYTLMHRDSYPRFVNSTMYKNLAQVSGSSACSNASQGEEPSNNRKSIDETANSKGGGAGKEDEIIKDNKNNDTSTSDQSKNNSTAAPPTITTKKSAVDSSRDDNTNKKDNLSTADKKTA